MLIEPGNIYTLISASDAPFCVALVLEKSDETSNRLAILYRPRHYRGGPLESLTDASPTRTSLYSVLEEQDSLDLLIPFIKHLAQSKDYQETAAHFNLEHLPLQQSSYYPDHSLVPVPEDAFSFKPFQPYAKALGLSPFIPPATPTTFL